MSQGIWTVPQRRRQSSLYCWMVDNHDRFAEALRAGGRPDWPALAAGLSAAALRDSRGHLPSAEVCRRTWRRARKNTAKRAQRLDAKLRARAATSGDTRHGTAGGDRTPGQSDLAMNDASQPGAGQPR
jgi:hypothetical protein